MGLNNGGNSNVTYVRLKDGKFYDAKDKEKANGFTDLDGTITSMFYKDETYENVPQRKLIINLQDGEENFRLSLNTDSQYYTTLVSFLKATDLSQPVTLHAKQEVGNKEGVDFKKNSILVSQDGTYSKGYFTKDNRHGAPEWEKVKVGKKVITDKSKYLDFLEGFVTENYINQLKGSTVAPKKTVAASEPVAEADQAMPWDD